jgi:hypothetical protein
MGTYLMVQIGPLNPLHLLPHIIGTKFEKFRKKLLLLEYDPELETVRILGNSFEMTLDSTLSSANLWLDDTTFLAPGYNQRSGIYVVGIKPLALVTNKLCFSAHSPCEGVRSEVRHIVRTAKTRAASSHRLIKARSQSSQSRRNRKIHSRPPEAFAAWQRTNLRYVGCYVGLPCINMTSSARQLRESSPFCFEAPLYERTSEIVFACVTNCPMLHNHCRIMILETEMLPKARGFIDVPGMLTGLNVHQGKLYISYLSNAGVQEDCLDKLPQGATLMRQDCVLKDLKKYCMTTPPHMVDPSHSYENQVMQCSFHPERYREFQHSRYTDDPNIDSSAGYIGGGLMASYNYKLCIACFDFPSFTLRQITG